MCGEVTSIFLLEEKEDLILQNDPLLQAAKYLYSSTGHVDGSPPPMEGPSLTLDGRIQPTRIWGAIYG